MTTDITLISVCGMARPTVFTRTSMVSPASLMVTTGAIMILGSWLPSSPLAPALGLVHLPGLYWPLLALTLLADYLRRAYDGDVRRYKEVDLGQAAEWQGLGLAVDGHVGLAGAAKDPAEAAALGRVESGALGRSQGEDRRSGVRENDVIGD